MLTFFLTTTDSVVIPIEIVHAENYTTWYAAETDFNKQYLISTQFSPKPGKWCCLFDVTGELKKVVFIVNDESDFLLLGVLPFGLPKGVYQMQSDNRLYQLAWGLGAYRFSSYKEQTEPAQLLVTDDAKHKEMCAQLKAIWIGRDLINTPLADLTPAMLLEKIKEHLALFKPKVSITKGKRLEKEYPGVYAVGKGSDFEPQLLDLQWGNKSHPTLTLVGKGVCFDTGGVNVKPPIGMLKMKKDMGGAAHAFALAYMIMSANLPVRLRLIIPAVDNAISSAAFRPGDVLTMRSGITVEITDTDAEGRLILADALTDAVEDKPDLLIDFATLTGAARVALGPDIPVLFTQNYDLATDIMEVGEEQMDPVWLLPLHQPYRQFLDSKVADIANAAKTGLGGAITAGLFLREFVPETVSWLHFDMMAWNTRSLPSRPEGGELMGVRTLYSYIKGKHSE